MSKELIALIDADSLIWKAGCVTDSSEPVSHALQIVKRRMQKIKRETGATELIPVVGSATVKNFRYTVFPEYKANRTAPRPHYFDEIHTYLIDRWDAVEVGEIEADDYVGIFNYMAIDDPDIRVVMCHIDKDLNMLEGEHYNYDTGLYYFVTQEDADRTFGLQVLKGDRTDNIPGLFAATGVKQTKALRDRIEACDNIHEVNKELEAIFYEAGNGDPDVMKQLQLTKELIWIRRE